MSPDQYRRIEAIERRQAIAEERDRTADERMERMEARNERIEEKLDKLLAFSSMGKGALLVIAWLGSGLAFVAGAIFWAADHFRWWIK